MLVEKSTQHSWNGFSFRNNIWVKLKWYLVAIFVLTILFSLVHHFHVPRINHDKPNIATESSKQIFVMGMPGTRTDLVVRLLIMMGAYPGEPEDLMISNQTSSSKPQYYEHKDVMFLNQWVLNEVGVKKGPKWTGFGFSLDQLPKKKRGMFSVQAETVVNKLNSNSGTWVAKDPRFSFLFPLWSSMVKNPICIIVYEHPSKLVKELMNYEGLGPGDWLVLWENYTRSAIDSCKNLPTIYVSQANLLNDIVKSAEKMHLRLSQYEVNDLSQLSLEQASSINLSKVENIYDQDDKITLEQKEEIEEEREKENKKVKEKVEDKSDQELILLTSLQKELVDFLEHLSEAPQNSTKDTVKKPFQIYETPIIQQTISTLTVDTKEKEAYVSIFDFSDDIDMELVSILTMIHSIRSVDSEREILVLITQPLSNEFITLLNEASARILSVNPITEYYSDTLGCQDVSTIDFPKFNLLHLWSLEQYDQILYLSTGALVFPKVHQLFEINDPFAAEREKKNDAFSPSFMVIKPDHKIYEKMIELLEMNREEQVRGSFFGNEKDCTVSRFLNEFFTYYKNIRIGKPTLFNHDYDSDLPSVSQCFYGRCPRPWYLAHKPDDIDFNVDPPQHSLSEEKENEEEGGNEDSNDGNENENNNDYEETKESTPPPLPGRKKFRGIRCALPRGCNAGLYRVWWKNFSSLNSEYYLKDPTGNGTWFSFRDRNQLYYGCSQAV